MTERCGARPGAGPTCVPGVGRIHRLRPRPGPALPGKGQHRRALPDLIIAVTAEAHGATVVHYGKDYDLISAVTGQPTLWIVPAGTV
ncbi:hypothetical protein [Nocardiopsis sp. CNT312]|uniref:hypothetical protein n=1 Tax=Nocardiopsis sp. CNT312 TaxID=1137268 RepID=UPI00048FE2E6|nr:hypothetical protein [Nocardiopsis sp. CNT312]